MKTDAALSMHEIQALVSSGSTDFGVTMSQARDSNPSSEVQEFPSIAVLYP